MDHNDFDFDSDFMQPLNEFFKQIGLRVEQISSVLNIDDDYYFPPDSVVQYEKTLIKNSIIWEIIEEKKKQEENGGLKKPVMPQTQVIPFINSLIHDTYNEVTEPASDEEGEKLYIEDSLIRGGASLKSNGKKQPRMRQTQDKFEITF